MDDSLQLLVDLHKDGERQGPGGRGQTQMALELSGLADRTGRLKIADIGCGTGASTIQLAQALDAQITAVDLFPDFLDQLQARAAREGVMGKITPSCCDMSSLPFAKASLDAIWSEGAIYNMGFEEGLAAWAPLLKPGGVLAVSDLVWLQSKRPEAIDCYWQRHYPGVALASEKLAILERYGFVVLGYFSLPPSCWLENYYRPLQARHSAFIARHQSPEAQALVDSDLEEISLYETYKDDYSYGFFIAQLGRVERQL